MRTAVCISGQPRFFKKGFDHIYENIIKPNHADVFMHCWHNDDQVGQSYCGASWNANQTGIVEANTIEKLEKLYKPKLFTWESEGKKIPAHKNENDYTYKIYSPVNVLFSMFYSIQAANNLKSLYEKENDFVYDAVIRIRYDVGILSPIFMANMDLTKINFPDFMWKSHDAICDYLCISNSSLMNKFCKVYDCMDGYSERQEVGFTGEGMLLHHLAKNEIDLAPQPISLFLIRNNELNKKFGKDYR